MISETIKLFAACSSLIIAVSTASAQVPRTFVSGLGVDGGSCTRIAPCRTFSAAIAQTNPGGEVVVLDSAGFGAFSIGQAVSIIAPLGVYAGVSVFSGNAGVIVSAGPSDVVVLRGLTVNNQGSLGNGIQFTTGALLHVENCVVNGFSGGNGIVFLASSNGTLEVKDSTLRGNDIGIQAAPDVGKTGVVTIDQTRLERNTTAALVVGDRSKVTMRNSIASGNATGLQVESVGSSPAELNVERCILSHNNGLAAVYARSLSTGVALARVSNSTLTNNTNGLFNVGAPAIVLSRGNNTVEGNEFDTQGSISSYTAK